MRNNLQKKKQANVVGNTTTHSTYWVIDSKAVTRIAKNPVPVILEDHSDIEEEENGGTSPIEDSEFLELDVRGWSPTQKVAEAIEPPITAAPKKRARKTAEQWTSQVGSRG